MKTPYWMALALGSLIVTMAGSASAYCRSLACSSSDPALKCSEVRGECPSGRPPLFWPSSCISFGLQMNGSLKYGIEYQEANAAAVAAFETWQNADCGDGKRPSLRIEDMGPMECGRHEYNPKGNANIFAFADEFWPYDKPYEDLALTLVTFDTRTGEIYDADIAINTANMRFVLADSESRGYDLTTVLTHEVGHFLGLGHSLETEATMRERYDSGVTDMRDLHADDIAGICALYPPDRDISSDACGPRKGFSDQCGGIPVDEEVASCSATRGRAGNGGVLVALAALAATYFRKPRRKTD